MTITKQMVGKVVLTENVLSGSIRPGRLGESGGSVPSDVSSGVGFALNQEMIDQI